jgi:hypothetical protein
MEYSESATFLASFPTIQSAIKIDGGGNGMRVQLDVPESEMHEAIKLLMWRECGLRVHITPEKHGVLGNVKESNELEKGTKWEP